MSRAKDSSENSVVVSVDSATRSTGLFVSSLRVYGRAWKTFIVHSAIFTTLTKILALSTDAVPDMFSLEGVSAPNTAAELSVFLLLTFTTLAFILTAHKSIEGESIGVKKSFLLSFKYYGSYILTISLFFACLGIIGTCGILLDALGSGFLSLLGSILLAALVIIFVSRYMFAPFAVIIEGSGVRNAFSRSLALSRGKILKIAFKESSIGLYFLMGITVPLFFLGLSLFIVFEKLGLPSIELMFVLKTFCFSIWVGLFIVFNVLYLNKLQQESDSSYVQSFEIARSRKANALKLLTGIAILAVNTFVCDKVENQQGSDHRSYEMDFRFPD